MAPENVMQVVREHPEGGKAEVTSFNIGPNDDVRVDTDKETGRKTVVIVSPEVEATDSVMLRTQEVVRAVPSSDAKAAKAALASEGGVHVGVDPGPDAAVDAKAANAGTAALPTGPDGVADPTQTTEQGGQVKKGSLQKAEKEQKATEAAST